MAVKTETKMYCDVCGQGIPRGGSDKSIFIRESKMCGQKGARTLNGDYCSKACFLKEIEESGAY